jgi:hypothetical protein
MLTWNISHCLKLRLILTKQQVKCNGTCVLHLLIQSPQTGQINGCEPLQRCLCLAEAPEPVSCERAQVAGGGAASDAPSVTQSLTSAAKTRLACRRCPVPAIRCVKTNDLALGLAYRAKTKEERFRRCRLPPAFADTPTTDQLCAPSILVVDAHVKQDELNRRRVHGRPSTPRKIDLHFPAAHRAAG